MNNFDVVKNYGFDDEEIVFNSDDYLECVSVCNEMQRVASAYERFAVYPSNKMLGIE